MFSEVYFYNLKTFYKLHKYYYDKYLLIRSRIFSILVYFILDMIKGFSIKIL